MLEPLRRAPRVSVLRKSSSTLYESSLTSSVAPEKTRARSYAAVEKAGKTLSVAVRRPPASRLKPFSPRGVFRC